MALSSMRGLDPLLLRVVIFSLVLNCVSGWGKEGHQIIANIAYQRLTNSTRQEVIDILGHVNGTEEAGSVMAAVADWADRVRYYYHWSAPLHYIDVRDDLIDGGCPCINNENSTFSGDGENPLCHFIFERDCPNEICVAGAINNYTEQVESLFQRSSFLRGSPKKYYNVREALMFLIHFVGDIHQPLHSGRISDKGGNTFSVQFPSHFVTPVIGQHPNALSSHHWNLHSVWDSAIIDRIMYLSYNNSRGLFEESLIDMIDNGKFTDYVLLWMQCPSGLCKYCTIAWGNESFDAALRWAYRNSDGQEVYDGTVLGHEYFETRKEIVMERLAAAGVRLAATLEIALGDDANYPKLD